MAEAYYDDFVPQFYLRNFADGVERQASFHVIDLKKRSLISGCVRDFAGLRNFNRVNIQGVGPNIYEAAYGKWEGEAAPLLREVLDMRSFLSD